MGKVELSKKRAAPNRVRESPEIALRKALEKVRDERRTREEALLRTRLGRA